MIHITCGRCGNVLGTAKTTEEAAEKNREHLADCTVDFWSAAG